jgi:hypothetical protein
MLQLLPHSSPKIETYSEIKNSLLNINECTQKLKNKIWIKMNFLSLFNAETQVRFALLT